MACKNMNTEHFKSITLQQMEAVIYLVEEGSFSRAAKRMLLTQPALDSGIFLHCLIKYLLLSYDRLIK
jgi:Bacterial regulatory helix-turn-helix protein, lysR family.